MEFYGLLGERLEHSLSPRINKNTENEDSQCGHHNRETVHHSQHNQLVLYGHDAQV